MYWQLLNCNYFHDLGAVFQPNKLREDCCYQILGRSDLFPRAQALLLVACISEDAVDKQQTHQVLTQLKTVGIDPEARVAESVKQQEKIAQALRAAK